VSWRDLVEIRAALRLIERSLHPERFKLFGQSNWSGLELELWQMKIDVALFEFCAAARDIGALVSIRARESSLCRQEKERRNCSSLPA
jgi:hypothetical protein